MPSPSFSFLYSFIFFIPPSFIPLFLLLPFPFLYLYFLYSSFLYSFYSFLCLPLFLYFFISPSFIPPSLLRAGRGMREGCGAGFGSHTRHGSDVTEQHRAWEMGVPRPQEEYRGAGSMTYHRTVREVRHDTRISEHYSPPDCAAVGSSVRVGGETKGTVISLKSLGTADGVPRYPSAGNRAFGCIWKFWRHLV
jgi:hypothetical protein